MPYTAILGLYWGATWTLLVASFGAALLANGLDRARRAFAVRIAAVGLLAGAGLVTTVAVAAAGGSRGCTAAGSSPRRSSRWRGCWSARPPPWPCSRCAHGEASGGVPSRSVTELTGPADVPADRAVTLTAQTSTVTLDDGTTVDAWTFDGTAPGPQLRVTAGELLEVTLINRDVPDGVTIHWHGVEVPNAEDGVAGVTQDAVYPGESYVYRFRPTRAGTFWYHSHQYSSVQVARGLYGVLVVEPSDVDREPVDRQTVDLAVAVHTWETPGMATLGLPVPSAEARRRRWPDRRSPTRW